MKKIAVTFLGLVILWFFTAWMIPITQDEAYYALWGKNLSWGYFDHPPMVALLTSIKNLFPSTSFLFESPLSTRMGSVLVASTHFWVIYALYQVWGLKNKNLLWSALLLMGTNFFGLVYGVVITPDTGLILFWSLSLYGATRALRGEQHFWLLTGFFVGCGLWSKYTMLVMGLVLLGPLLWEVWKPSRKPPDPMESDHQTKANRPPSRPALLTPWPYLGGIIALVVFLPHLLWNSQHQWMTIRFQFRHGFSMERPDLEGRSKSMEAQTLPRAQASSFLDREYVASIPFLKVKEQEKAREKTWVLKILEVLNIYVGFLGSQVALWGFWLIFIVPPLFTSVRNLTLKNWFAPQKTLASAPDQQKNTRNPVEILILSSCWVPLIFFLVLSPFTKIEANWSAMYLIGASALLARWISQGDRQIKPDKPMSPLTQGVPRGFYLGNPSRERTMVLLALMQGGLLILLALHSRFHIFPLRSDRLQKETAGYRELGDTLGEFLVHDPILGDRNSALGAGYSVKLPYRRAPQVPFFVESYQLASMIQYYFPHWRLRQWPGVTRDSEFSQNQVYFEWDYLDIAAGGGFWLLVHNVPIPKIFPFTPDQIVLLRDCKTSRLQVIRDPKAFVDGKSLGEGQETPCPSPRRSLYLVRYRT
jgi:4-amino-4-deoxy-L-arabinose transferase-like glycosyltransferase